MDQIINQVASRTGVDAATVQKVLHEAVGIVKGHLPPALAGQVDSLLGSAGGGSAGGQQGGDGGGLGGMLGGLLGGGK